MDIVELREKALQKLHFASFLAKESFKDEKASAELFKLVIGVFIIAILGGALLPTGLDALVTGSNESGTWTPGMTSTYDAIGIILLVVVIAGLAGLAYKAVS